MDQLQDAASAIRGAKHLASHPRECWKVLRELLYDHLNEARPNEAHRVLARWVFYAVSQTHYFAAFTIMPE